MIETDVIVVGGGIAGAGAAYEIAAFKSVVLLERESQCGYHATGRSAASFTENYGTSAVRRLALASREFLAEPPMGFARHPLLEPRGTMTIARADQAESLARNLDRARALVPAIHSMTPAEAIARVPILRRDYVAAAMMEPDAMEIDVNGLHQGFLRGAKRNGARILTGAEAIAIARSGDRWRVDTTQGEVVGSLVVNAAGAWADEVASLAGVRPIGLIPKRRTAFHVALDVDMAGWPLVDDVGEQFYFKRDAGQLFVSPADATSSAPMDAYADDLDVAVGVERLEAATNLSVRRVGRSWAGLRSFVADGSPVVGFDPLVEGFFWLVGQGGYGIKTSPALSRACASLIRRGELPDDLLRFGLSSSDLLPDRLSQRATV